MKQPHRPRVSSCSFQIFKHLTRSFNLTTFVSGRPYSLTENPHRRHRSSEKMESFTEMLTKTSSPTGGISCREQCPQEVERVQERNTEFSVTDHDEETPNDSCAIDHTPASMEVELNDSVNATEEQPGEQLEDAVDEDNALVDANATLLRQLEERSREHRTAMREKREITQAHAALKQDCEAQRNQNKALRRANESLSAILEQRTSELHGVERFFTTADKFSGSEVVSTLRKLNEGVQQSGTFMAEWVVRNLKFEAPRVHQTSTRVDEQTRASGLLGAQFMRVLTRKQVVNPTLVEIAFQAYLMCELCTVASQRSTQGSHSAVIEGIYQRMCAAEGQAISGNWRALTHRYAASAHTEGPDIMRMVETTIVSGLSDILLAVGCTNSTHDITSALRSKFADKIRDFVSLARDINMIIGAGVISEDLEILWVRPETPFDGKVMQDWDDDGKGQEIPNVMERPRETVLCTIELGLMKRTKAAAAGKRNEIVNSIMVKPKVALVSILNVI